MKNSKFITLFVAFAAIFFLTLSTAYSDSYHSIVYEQAPITISTQAIEKSSAGAASAIAASQHNYYWGKSELQGSAAIGSFDGNTAFSFGLAKKYKKTLINGSISNEGGKIGAGAGINWIF